MIKIGKRFIYCRSFDHTWRITLGMSGDSFNNGKMEYSIKVFIADPEIQYDFFTRDKPNQEIFLRPHSLIHYIHFFAFTFCVGHEFFAVLRHLKFYIDSCVVN